MFELDHHQKILTILKSLNVDFFDRSNAYFGGGTQLALQFGEYRWSKDIDFICPYGEGYRSLRHSINQDSYNALFTSTDDLTFPRDIKADQYGIRFAVLISGTLIKFEIIAEGRITLGTPEYPEWSPVPCLNFEDACTEKLFSNADRWADTSIESRDLIDLAVLRQQAEIPAESYQKAEEVYPVKTPLIKAIQNFQNTPEYRTQCFTELQIEAPSYIIDGIDLLAADLEIEKTPRTYTEEG